MKIYSIENQNIRAEFSDVGGKLMSLSLDGENLLWQGDPAYWDDRAPILFPFCGKCRDGFYRWQGGRYPMSIHGFLPGTLMRVAAQESDAITFRLDSDAATRAVYPFDFTLELAYRLTARGIGLRIDLTAGNLDVPFSIGAHPGFVLPGDGCYRLRLSGDRLPIALEITENGLLGQARTPIFPDESGDLVLTPEILGQCGLFLQDIAPDVILWRENSAHRVRLRFDGFPTLGLWQPTSGVPVSGVPDCAPFLCVEPWAGLPAPDGEVTDLESKPGTLRAKAGESVGLEMDIEIVKSEE